MAHGNQGALPPAVTRHAAILGSQVGVLGVTRGPGRLGQGFLEPAIARGNASSGPLSGTHCPDTSPPRKINAHRSGTVSCPLPLLPTGPEPRADRPRGWRLGNRSQPRRSEERRVGKSVDTGGGRER